MQVSVCRHLNMRLHIYCRQILFLTLNQRVGQLRHSLSVRAWRGRTHFARPMAYPCVALHFVIAFSCYDVRGWRIFRIRLCGMGLSAIPARILLFLRLLVAFCTCAAMFLQVYRPDWAACRSKHLYGIHYSRSLSWWFSSGRLYGCPMSPHSILWMGIPVPSIRLQCIHLRAGALSGGLAQFSSLTLVFGNPTWSGCSFALFHCVGRNCGFPCFRKVCYKTAVRGAVFFH